MSNKTLNFLANPLSSKARKTSINVYLWLPHTCIQDEKELFQQKMVTIHLPTITGPGGPDHFAMPIYDCVLMCCGHPDWELPDLTFAMWYAISEELYHKDQDHLTAKFRPHIVQLINVLCR